MYSSGYITALNYAKNGVDVAAYSGRADTPWKDTIGSNDGTPSGDFLTVGQKRQTILQTAGMDWNKYAWFNGVDTSVDTGVTLSDIDSASSDFTFSVWAIVPAGSVYIAAQAHDLGTYSSDFIIGLAGV